MRAPRHRRARDDECPGDEADAGIDLDGVVGEAGQSHDLARVPQPALRSPLEPEQLADQVARPRDAERRRRAPRAPSRRARRRRATRRGPPTPAAGRRACAARSTSPTQANPLAAAVPAGRDGGVRRPAARSRLPASNSAAPSAGSSSARAPSPGARSARARSRNAISEGRSPRWCPSRAASASRSAARRASAAQPRRRQAQRAPRAVGALELGGDAGTGLGHRGAETREPPGQALDGRRRASPAASPRTRPRGPARAGSRTRARPRSATPPAAAARAGRARPTRPPTPADAGHERIEPAEMEHLSLDRRRLDQPALRRAQRVEASREQRMQGRRERALLAAPGDVRREVLQEQRVPARLRDDAPDGRRPRAPAGRRAGGGSPPRPPAPAGSGRRSHAGRAAQQLGPADAEHEHGRRDRARARRRGRAAPAPPSGHPRTRAPTAGAARAW